MLDGTFISAYTNGTTVTLSQATTNSTSGNTILIGGDQFYSGAYIACMDPVTGWWYFAANNSTVAGTCAGIFCLPGVDQAPVLVKSLPQTTLNNLQMFIAGGNLYLATYGPMRTLASVGA